MGEARQETNTATPKILTSQKEKINTTKSTPQHRKLTNPNTTKEQITQANPQKPNHSQGVGSFRNVPLLTPY